MTGRRLIKTDPAGTIPPVNMPLNALKFSPRLASLLAGLACALVALSAYAEPEERARAFVIETPEQALAGPAATGGRGDLRMENPHLSAVILSAEHTGRDRRSGGALVDIAPTGGLDALGEIAPAFDPQGRRTAIFSKVFIAQAGSSSTPAIVRAEGVDSLDDQIAVTIDYVLEPDASTLKMVTTVRHKGRSHYDDFAIGRYIRWGSLSPFAPGVGVAPIGRRTRTDWIGASGPAGALLMAPSEGIFTALHGDGWTVTAETEPYLRPATTLVHSAMLMVSREGGEAAVQARLYALRKTVTGSILGQVSSQDGPVPDARIIFLDGDRKPFTRARTNAEGRYQVALPSGRYGGRIEAPGRAPGEMRWFRVLSDTRASVNARLGNPGAVDVRITGEGRLLPGRVVLKPLGRTRKLTREGAGPAWQDPETGAAARGPVLMAPTGQGRFPVVPGRYEAMVSAGPWWSRQAKPIEIVEGLEMRLEIELKRAVDPGAHVILDPRVHTDLGPETEVAWGIRLAGCLSEGVQVAAVDAGTWGMPQVPAALKGLRIIPAAHPPADRWGRFGALPAAMGQAPWSPEARPAARLEALSELANLPAVVVFDPRGPQGYFTHYNFDPAQEQLPRGGFSLAFNLLEVGQGQVQDRLEASVADYLGLLARGHVVAPIASGAGLGITRGACGLPFTLIRLEKPAEGPPPAEAVRRALIAGQTVASYGPLLDLKVDGVPAGGRVAAGKPHKVEVVVRAAGWMGPERLTVYLGRKAWKSLKLPRSRALDIRRTFTLPARHRGPVVVMVDGRPQGKGVHGQALRPFAITAPVWIGEAGATTP